MRNIAKDEDELNIIKYLGHLEIFDYKEIDIDIDGVLYSLNKDGFKTLSDNEFRMFYIAEREGSLNVYKLRDDADFNSLYRSRLDYIYKLCYKSDYPKYARLFYYFWGTYLKKYRISNIKWSSDYENFINIVIDIIKDVI